MPCRHDCNGCSSCIWSELTRGEEEEEEFVRGEAASSAPLVDQEVVWGNKMIHPRMQRRRRIIPSERAVMMQ